MQTKRHKFPLKLQMKLLDAAREYIISKGARPTPNASYQYRLETPYGAWDFSFSTSEELATVFTRFDEPQRVSAFWNWGINRYSGKFNFHWNKQELADALNYFKSEVNRFTTGNEEPQHEISRLRKQLKDAIAGGNELYHKRDLLQRKCNQLETENAELRAALANHPFARNKGETLC